jgi:hypothetical protein
MRQLLSFSILVLCLANFTQAQPTAYAFLDFSGKVLKQKAEISWVTTQELNLHHFNVQRSYNGFEYLTVSSTDAKGTTTGKTSYKFTDLNATSGSENILYRLQCVDKNGNVSYSSIIRLQMSGHQPRITVMNSSVIKNELHLNISSIEEKPAFILISNQQGIAVKKLPVALFNGTFSQALDISSLAKGMYFITINTGADLLRERFIKQ